MRKTHLRKYCLECKQIFLTLEKRSKFCSHRCSAIYGNRRRDPPTEEHKRKVSQSLKAYWKNNPDKIRRGEIASKNAAKGTKGKYNRKPKNIYNLSSRTRRKIMQRLNTKCCRCAWGEGSCDIHHFYGRKGNDPHNHSKICCICPNCHRLVHEGKVSRKELKSFEEQFGDKWLEYYYG